MVKDRYRAPLREKMFSGTILHKIWHRWFTDVGKKVDEIDDLNEKSLVELYNIDTVTHLQKSILNLENKMALQETQNVEDIKRIKYLENEIKILHGEIFKKDRVYLDSGIQNIMHSQCTCKESSLDHRIELEPQIPFRLPLTGSNYFQIENDGTIVFYGDATVWEDENVGTAYLARGANAPDLINLNATNILVPGFDGAATTESLHGSIEVPHAHKTESSLYFHVHWLPSNAGAGDVKWQLEYTITNTDDTEPASTTISIIDSTDTTAWKNHFISFAAISMSGKTLGSQFSFRFFRDPTDGSDTYGSDAAVKTLGFHFEKDMDGSRQITTK
jgi:hypothetical protein